MRFLLFPAVCFLAVIGLNGQENSVTISHADFDQDILLQRSIVENALENSGDSSHIAAEIIRLGDLYRTSEFFSEAMKQYHLASTYLNPSGSDSLAVRLKIRIARIDVAVGNYNKARTLLKEALLMAVRVKDLRGKAQSYGLLGICDEKQGDYLSALEFQKKSLDLFTALADPHEMAITEANIGSIYEDLGQYELALEYFIKAYDYLEAKPIGETVSLLNDLGDIMRKQGRVREGMKYTEEARSLAQNLGDLHQLESAHKDLSKGYASMGDYTEAYRHLHQADAYRNEAQKDFNTKQVNVIHTLYELDKKESEIQLLREQNKVSSANQHLLGISVGALVLLLVTLAIMVAGRQRAQSKLQKLRDQNLKAEYERIAKEEADLQREVTLKSTALTRYSLHIANKNKLLMDLSRSLSNMAARKHIDNTGKLHAWVREIENSLSQDHEWDEFLHIFEEIHPDFTKKLNTLAHATLSPSELRLGMLLRMNLSSKEIASILRVTPDSVRVARYRLRKKLPIEQKKELVNFMVEL